MTSSGLLAWAVAPDWLTTAQAATLMGAAFTAKDIGDLVVHGNIVGEITRGQLLVELRSLGEFRDALCDIASVS